MSAGLVHEARAEPLPYTQTLSLGRPAHPIRTSIEARGEALTLVVGSKRHALPAKSASDVALEVVRVAEDAAIAVLRVSTADGRWVGVLGGRSGQELLFFERAEPTGDPGERRTRELAVSGDPDRAVHTGISFEGVSSCGGRTAWLEPQRLDPASLTFVDALPPNLPSALVDATVRPADDAVAPTLPGLSAAASSQLDTLTQLPRVPRALVDGDAASGIPARAGQFFTLRWQSAALPIERLELALKSDARPIELWWLTESERGLRAQLPAVAGARRVVIAPPAPLTGHCLALVIASAGTLELREIAAYSALDQPEGLERVLGMVVQDEARAGALMDVLARLGPRAAARLAARWPELSPRSKRRGLKVLGRSLEQDAVRAVVLEAARGEDAALRDAALDALKQGGEPGRAGLRELAREGGVAGERAVGALAQPSELPGLLTMLSAPGGSERAALRDAITRAAKADAELVQTLHGWLHSEPGVQARSAGALALAHAARPELALELAAPILHEAKSFEDRYRLALALAAADASEPVDAWLAGEAERAQEWMQRRAAFDALVQRNAAVVPELAGKLAHDGYPRVRAATMLPLLAAGKRELVEVLLGADAWPMVRAQAALALGSAPGSRAVLEGALKDDSPEVRRAAIEALVIARSAASWPQVLQLLKDDREALDVREAALTFLRTFCVVEAGEPMLALARQLDSPDASDADLELALEALRVLHDLGGAAQASGAAWVEKLADPKLSALWQRLPPARCTPRTHAGS